MKQYAGRDGNGEWLVTVHDAADGRPAAAEVAWRPNEWDTWSAPVQLEAVPVTAVTQ
jgi:hypothetical protein